MPLGQSINNNVLINFSVNYALKQSILSNFVIFLKNAIGKKIIPYKRFNLFLNFGTKGTSADEQLNNDCDRPWVCNFTTKYEQNREVRGLLKSVLAKRGPEWEKNDLQYTKWLEYYWPGNGLTSKPFSPPRSSMRPAS